MRINSTYLQIILVLNYILAAENDPVLSTVVASTMLTVYMMFRVVEVGKEYELSQHVVSSGLFGCFLIHARLIDLYNSMLSYRLMLFGMVLLFLFAGVVGFAEQHRQQRINRFMNNIEKLDNVDDNDDSEDEEEDSEEDSEDDSEDEEDDSDDTVVNPPAQFKRECEPSVADQPTQHTEPTQTTCLMYCGSRTGYEAIVREMFKDRFQNQHSKCDLPTTSPAESLDQPAPDQPDELDQPEPDQPVELTAQ